MANYSINSIEDLRRKVTQVHEYIATSYHEAGHTIYGLLHFMKIESVYVFEHKKSKRIEGFTHYESPPLKEITDNSLLMDRVLAEVCLSYAGLVAEKHQFKLFSGSDKFPSFLKDGSSNDTMEAATLIKKYNVAPPGRKRYEFKKKMIKKVSLELQDNWDAVTLVAHALFQKKKLYFADLKELLTKKTKNKKFWKEQFKTLATIYDFDDGLYRFPISILTHH
jgi:hypothetical protein